MRPRNLNRNHVSAIHHVNRITYLCAGVKYISPNYLTILHEDTFHVFLNTDVVRLMGDCFEVANSSALREGEWDEQKVIMRYEGQNIGELEMRNDSPRHYQQVRFNMNIQPAMALLLGNIQQEAPLRGAAQIAIHGNAARRFGRWV